jgi:hypothetical protein
VTKKYAKRVAAASIRAKYWNGYGFKSDARMNAGEKEIDSSFGSNYESFPNGPLSFRLDLLGGPTAMPKQSRSSALKAVKTAKLRI